VPKEKVVEEMPKEIVENKPEDPEQILEPKPAPELI